MILLLLSGPDGFKCPAPHSSAFSPPSLHHHQCRRCCFVGSRLVRVLVPSLSSHHSCRCPVQSLWWRWVACLMLMILRMRLSVASSLALCPVQSSFGIPTRDDRWHSPLQYAPHSRVFSCVPLAFFSQCTIDSFFSRSHSCGSSRVALQQAFDPLPAACELAVVRIQPSRPSTGFQSSSGMLHCALVVSPGLSLLRAGLWPPCGRSSAAFSVLAWPATSPTGRSMIPFD